MRCIAGDQHAPFVHLARHDLVDGPLRHGLDADRNVRIADGRAGARHHGRLAEVGLAGRGVVHKQQHPFVPRPHTDVRAAAHPVVVARLRHPVQDAGAVRRVLGKVYLEPAVDCRAQAHLAFGLEADLLADHAVVAVAADRVARHHLEVLAADAVVAHGMHGVRVLPHRHQLGVEKETGAALARRVEQDGLHQVLWDVAHRRGAGQLVVGAPLGPGAPGLQARDLGAGEAGGPHVVAHQVVGRGRLHHALLDAEVAKYLHRALVGDVRARRVGGAGKAGERQGLDALRGQVAGGREARGAGADDQHRNFDLAHGEAPCVLTGDRIAAQGCQHGRQHESPDYAHVLLDKRFLQESHGAVHGPEAMGQRNRAECERCQCARAQPRPAGSKYDQK
ncbi:hypothetical protein FQZ97_769340 [compost metagenome]